MKSIFLQKLQEYSSQLNLSIAQLIYNALPADCSDLTDDELAQTLINYVETVFPHRINQSSTTIDYSSVDQFLIDYHKPTDQILVNCCWLQTQLNDISKLHLEKHKLEQKIEYLDAKLSRAATELFFKQQSTPQYKTLNVYS